MTKQVFFKNVTELDSYVSNLESGKSRVAIGDIREIRKIIFDLLKTNPTALALLMKHTVRK